MSTGGKYAILTPKLYLINYPYKPIVNHILQSSIYCHLTSELLLYIHLMTLLMWGK